MQLEAIYLVSNYTVQDSCFGARASWAKVSFFHREILSQMLRQGLQMPLRSDADEVISVNNVTAMELPQAVTAAEQTPGL